jgi:phage gpG-like protein
MQPVIKLDDSEVRKYLQKITDKLRNPAKLLMPIVAAFGLKDIDSHFKNESGPDGKWKERSDWTQQYYEKIRSGAYRPPAGQSRALYNPANRILQMTGALRESFVPGNVSEHGKNAVKVVSNIDYSKIHDQGGKKGKATIPARPFMWMSDNAMKLMARALLDAIAGED